MMTSRLPWHSRRGFVFSAGLLLVILLLWCVCSSALAQQPVGQPADVAPPPAKVESGTYMNPIWLFFVIVCVMAWMYVTGWVGEDAMGTGISFRKWTSFMLGAGLFGLVFILLVHAAFGFLLLVSVGGTFALYVRVRNREVPDQFKLFTRKKGGDAQPVVEKSAVAKEVRERLQIRLLNKSQASLDDFVEQQPGLAEAAVVLSDLIARASLAKAISMRLERHGAAHVVRFDVDGVVQNMDSLEGELGQAVLACVAKFAGLKGKAPSSLTAFLPGGEEVHIQVRVAKTGKGPMIVLSWPDWTADLFKEGLSALGMHKAMAEKVMKATEVPKSAVLISGQPGSGRTSTLHAMISQIDIFTTDITVLEKKSEHDLPQVVRKEVDLESSEAFGKVLADVMREEPNVVALDELTTAQQGGQVFEFVEKGGRLLATMEAANSGQAVQRLLLGVDARVASRALACVLNQRLLRKLCPHCKEPIEPSPKLLAKLQVDSGRPGTWFKPVGCEECLNLGYRGRIAMFEMLLVNDAVRKVIAEGQASADAVRKSAGKAGIRTLLQDGILKVRQGITTIDEVRRVLK